MAVTIEQSPQLYTPSDNPVVWVFSSDQTAQPNFYYLVEVYVGGVLIERHRSYLENGIYGKYDASSVTERYANLINGDIAFETDAENYNTCYIKVFEYYGSPAVEEASATSSTINFFKSRLTKRNFINWNYLNYSNLSASVSGGKFLTLFPRNERYKVGENEKLFLSIIDNNDLGVNVVTYESDGTLIDSKTYSALGTDKIKSFDVSKNGLQTAIPTLDFTNASYWTVEVENILTAITSEIFTIYLDSDCNYSTSKRLHFLNSLGAIDSFTFGLLSREETSVTSFGYEKQFGEFNGSSYDFNLEQGTTVDYLKETINTLKLTSDWLSQDLQNWLVQELYTSPCVWLENNGNLERVKITNTSYSKKIQENDMLFQEEVTINLGSDTSVNL